MPSIEAEYLIAHLFEIGPAMASGGYPAPITHEELLAWTELAGIELQPWEARFLRRLSCEYIAESQRAEKADCPAPSKQHEFAPDLSAVARSLKESMERLAKL
jgi:hypothetical protein